MPSELTPAVLSAWFIFAHQVLPVGMVIGQTISRPRGPIEVDLMLMAACAEAVHREVLSSKGKARERLKELVAYIGDLAVLISGPGGGPRDEWTKRVVDARNDLAHMNRSDTEDLYTFVGEMHVLYESLRWLLTAVVLRHVGVPPGRVTEVVTSTSGFGLFQERALSLLPSVYGTSTG